MIQYPCGDVPRESDEEIRVENEEGLTHRIHLLTNKCEKAKLRGVVQYSVAVASGLGAAYLGGTLAQHFDEATEVARYAFGGGAGVLCLNAMIHYVKGNVSFNQYITYEKELQKLR